MTIDDYDGVYALWMTIKGFAIRSIDDSKVGVERFLKRNPTTSMPIRYTPMVSKIQITDVLILYILPWKRFIVTV